MITLNEQNRKTKISLQYDIGEIFVTLHSKKKNNLFDMFKKKEFGLNLGAYVQFLNDEQVFVQALDNKFGNFNKIPYVFLKNDTKDSSYNECLYINSKHINEIKKIIIYIYKNIPKWNEIMSTVTIQIPGQDIVEIPCIQNEYTLSYYAIACINKEDDMICIERLNRYFIQQNDIIHEFK